jgi:putative photosynthetic complex assembly protein 2
MTVPAATAASAAPDAPRADRRVMLKALLFIGTFWWLATGLVVAIQRDDATRLLALVVATALAGAGAWLIRSRRHDATPAGARASLFGGALLWAWISTAFYGGWIVGPGQAAGGSAAAGTAPSLVLALEVIHATSWNEAVSIAAMLLAWALCRGAPNRLGLHVLVVFWAMHQLARLNIFVGVVNPATRFLPERLFWLTDYFGPARNTAFLAFSVLLLTGLAVLLLQRARSSDRPFRRHGAAMLGILVALGALEHALMGFSFNVPLWDFFLGLRG